MGKIKIKTRRKLFKCFALLLLWRDGAVVRALTSYQYGPGSNPGVDAICGYCFFFNYMGVEFVLYVGWVCFNLVFLRVLRSSPLLKNQHFQILIRPGIMETKNHFVDVLPTVYMYHYYLTVTVIHVIDTQTKYIHVHVTYSNTPLLWTQ